jgi:diaminopimelate decarboxylase
MTEQDNTTRPRYEKPVIVRQTPGAMNKFGRRFTVPVQTHIEGQKVTDLIAEHGSPLFVFSERKLREQARELRDALALRYPRVQLAWSYKTNYLGAVCRVFHQEGAWAEVVSAFEYERALQLGNDPSTIVFNGPHKPARALEHALSGGSLVNIDHYDELGAAEKIAVKLGIRPGVGMRVNLSTGSTPAWDRFGFNLENGQALAAAERIMAGGKLRLVGLHCHIGTFILEPEAYKVAAGKLARFANELREKHGIVLEVLDLGGGLASRNTLHAQYLPGEQATPSFAQYAEAIADGLEALEAPPSQRPTLILESGRSLVDEAGSLVASVVATKRLADSRKALVLDAGVNVLFTSFWYKHEIRPAVNRPGRPEATAVFGPLCMQIDVIRESMNLPALQPGDPVVIGTVGAYNVTQWMQFITLRPAVVMITTDGRVERIRDAETIEDVIGPERVPAHLV